MSMFHVEKTYYNINEVAQMLGVTATTLRYWEKEFDEIKPYRNKKRDRYFTTQDIEILQTIQYLTKVKGYTIAGAKEALKNNNASENSYADAVASLTQIKNFLLEVKAELAKE